ncbi:MAG: Ig-like domain-containing protein, partial [Pseudomonadota bacterium]|nr:Ig-like domain-containing protein [Pseudomonadota bacterium]
ENYTFKWDLKTLPEGNFNLYAVAQEEHGPKTKIPLFHMTSDRTPPQLDIQITGGDQISTLDQFLISVTDTYDTEPEITDIRLEGGPAKDRVQLSWRKASSGLFRLEYPIMFPSLKAGEGYTLTVTAMDAQENATTKDFQFRYEPRQISLADGMDGKLMIPAVAQEFQRLDGGHVIQTEPITLSGDTVVSGTYDVFATLRSDAEVPLVVNGVVIRPGETMSVMNQHNFASSGGRINLPLRPAEGGIEGTSNLLVMTSAPNSPVLVLNVKAWEGKAKLSAENWEVRQVIDPVSITASPETGVACRLTSDEEAARSTDPIRDPVCLIEWDETPDETEQVSAEAQGLKMTALKGQAVALGEQPVSYSMYLFSGDGRKIRVGGGHETLKVTSAFGSVGYKPMNDLNEVYRVIQDFDVRMKQSKGPSCSLTLDPARAQDAAESRRVGDASKTCLFEWVEVPDGIQQDPLSNTPYLFGTLREKTAHKLRWRVSIFSRNGTRVTLATESHAIDAIDPPAPDISVWSSYHYQDDLYMVPKEGGHIGDAIFDAEPSPLDIKVQRGEEELTNETFQPGRGMFSQIYRRLNTEPANLWDETSFRFDAAYNLLPEISSEKTIRAIAVPGDNIAPRIDVGDVREALDTAPLSVSVNITDLMNPGMEYDPEEMGEWEIRLGREERYNEITPMTEFTDAPDGSVSFDLDLTGIDRLMRLIAEARLKSPIEGYERIEKSQRLYMTVLRGGAIDADIEARRLSGPAPFTTVLQVGLEDLLDRAATGDVVWEVSADGGKSWESETRTDRNRMRWYNTFQKGEYLVRAKIINSNSGIESYTETVEVIAYDQVTVEVEGAETMFVGTSETYNVKAVGPNGEPMEDAVIKWTEDRGKSFFHVGDSYTVSSDEPKRFRFEAWVRDASAPDDDRYAYTRARVSASFQPIRGPKVYLRGPKVIEVGKEYQYEAQLAPPYRGMEVDMDGYFVLPNGERASGQTLTYAPTEQDLETGRIKLNYVAWVEGFKDAGTEASRELYARVWKYVWPKFTLYTRTSVMVAPVEVSAYARALSFRGKLDNPVYTWEIPEGDGVEVTDKRWDDVRKFVITEPGTYTLKATITDARGNDAVVERTLEVGEADPYEVGISFNASNSHNRAPLGLYLRPSVQGGHPRDRVTDYTYSVNGEPIETRGIAARLELPEGQHDVGLTIKTLMGEEITETKTFNVIPNVPPTCEVEVTDSSSSWMLRAKCEDVDGDMQSYQWKVNGNELAARSYRLRIYKSTYDDIMPMIEVVGIDDAGDASDPVIVK